MNEDHILRGKMELLDKIASFTAGLHRLSLAWHGLSLKGVALGVPSRLGARRFQGSLDLGVFSSKSDESPHVTQGHKLWA